MHGAETTTDLERSALHALAQEWHTANAHHFDGLLRPPTLSLSEVRTRLGRWLRLERRVELDRSLVFGRPWSVVREVLKHEMAHQFVDEVLLRTDETAHGPAFQRVCADRGIDASAAGEPTTTEGQAPPRVIERVAKLLALASSANEHEAHTAMSAAQRLMLEHNLAAQAQAAQRRFVSRELGEPVTRMEQARQIIGSVLAEHFFVEVIRIRAWRPSEGTFGFVLEITGTPENVAMAEYVYGFLDRTADALWAQHKAAHNIAQDRERRAFRTGVILGFRDKLTSERATHAERGLVWVGDPALAEHHQRRYPRVRSARGYLSGSAEAMEHGEAAGRSIVLNKPVTGGGNDGGPVRRLTDGRR